MDYGHIIRICILLKILNIDSNTIDQSDITFFSIPTKIGNG